MIKVENVEVYGWEAAIRGMRNPMNSWDKSDSYPAVDCGKCGKIEREGCRPAEGRDCTGFYCYEIGKNDLKLMKTLVAAGPDHGKFLRMITVTLDIIAPLYWWKEFDTYKVGTVANSCSTMHKIQEKEFTLDDFSHEHLIDFVDKDGVNYCWYSQLDYLTVHLNAAREKFLETKDKKFWWQMIQLLPTSYNQRRTVQLNYAVLKNIYHARKGHKLDEWNQFCQWIEGLSYSELITV